MTGSNREKPLFPPVLSRHVDKYRAFRNMLANSDRPTRCRGRLAEFVGNRTAASPLEVVPLSSLTHQVFVYFDKDVQILRHRRRFALAPCLLFPSTARDGHDLQCVRPVLLAGRLFSECSAPAFAVTATASGAASAATDGATIVSGFVPSPGGPPNETLYAVTASDRTYLVNTSVRYLGLNTDIACDPGWHSDCYCNCRRWFGH